MNIEKLEKLKTISAEEMQKWEKEKLQKKFMQIQEIAKLGQDVMFAQYKQIQLNERVIHQRNQEKVTLATISVKNEKIIKAMAEQLAGLAIYDNDKENAIILGDAKEVIKYFTKKVEGKENE